MPKVRVGESSRTCGGKKGAVVTLGTGVGLVVAMGVTLWGTGAANHTVASFDASSWLFSSDKGEVARVNGVTGRVDTRQKITDAQKHTLQVSQSDRYVILRDLATGKISVLDLSSLTLGATTDSTPGIGVTVAIHDNLAFVVDQLQGLVRQLDPATLAPVGPPLSFPPGISGGTFDDEGNLWLLVPSEGTVVSVKAAALPATGPDGSPSARAMPGGEGGGASVDPRGYITSCAASPCHYLALPILTVGSPCWTRPPDSSP